jgi:hypothetical protein
VIGAALAAGLALPLAGLVGLASPAGAAETTFDDTCADVYGHPATGSLDKTTDPVAGSPVAPGQEVDVTVKWPTFAVAGPRNHRLMECVSVDGHSAQLAADRQFTSAEGTMTLAETVPAGLASGSTVCGQSFLKTQGSFGPVTRWSEKTCYPVGNSGSFHALSRVPSPPSGSSAPPPSSSKSPDNRTTPSTRGPYSSSPPSGSGGYKAPWPPWEKDVRPPTTAPPVVVTPTTVAPSTKAAPSPRAASGTQSAAPAAQAPVRQPSKTLPRTGAGIVVLQAVAAVALFSGRQLQKASDHIAENLPVPAVPVDDEDRDEPTLILGRRW